jgi:uncharacterized repeat protein (TIGR01451 family)
VEVPVLVIPAPTITKTAPGITTANVGQTIGYEIIVSNHSRHVYQGDFTVIDVLDTGFVSLVANSIVVSRGGVALPASAFTLDLSTAGTIRVLLHNLPAYSDTVIAFRVAVLPAAAGNTVRNTAVLQQPPCTTTGITPPPITTPEVAIPVLPPEAYQLVVLKEAVGLPQNGHVIVGETVTYRIAVTNTGIATSGGVVITDIIPQGMTLVPGSAVTYINGIAAPHIAPDIDGQTLRWFVPFITPGEEVTVSFQVTVDPLPAGVYSRTFSNIAVVNDQTSNEVLLQTSGLVKLPDRSQLVIGELINWTLRGFHNPTGHAVSNFAIVDVPGRGLNFQSGRLPAFTNGEGITYEIRYRIAGGEWQVHATDINAAEPFNFSLPQPGNIFYSHVGLFFGDVPAGFALGNEITYTFITTAEAPNNILINNFLIMFDEEEVPGSSPERPVVVPPPTIPEVPVSPTPLPPGTELPPAPPPYIPWDERPADDAILAQQYDQRYEAAYELDPVNPMPISPLHHAYMIGFREDGTVRPQANMTRAEAVTIFFRLMDDSHRASIWSQENSFNDVNEGQWFNNAISTMANAGLITGHGGYFRPNDPITRAEFAIFAARFMGHGNSTVSGGRFSDTAGHWAESQINVANELGWVTGFHDGTFRPNQHITRAEVAALTNRVLQRLPETVDDLLPDMIMWPDNTNQTTWYFIYIQEATNSNYFEMKADGIHKTWTGLFAPRNWSALERPYSTP